MEGNMRHMMKEKDMRMGMKGKGGSRSKKASKAKKGYKRR